MTRIIKQTRSCRRAVRTAVLRYPLLPRRSSFAVSVSLVVVFSLFINVHAAETSSASAVLLASASSLGPILPADESEGPLAREGMLPPQHADQGNADASLLTDDHDDGNKLDRPREGVEAIDPRYTSGNGVLPTTLEEQDEVNEGTEEDTPLGGTSQGGRSGQPESPLDEGNDEGTGDQDGDEGETPDTGDGEDEDHDAEFDFEYYLPHQYRRVIPGTNIDYYDYVLMEERHARGETDEPPPDRNGLVPSEGQKPLPVVNSSNGVFSYCYTTAQADILERCSQAATLGVGVYIPIVNMTDFGRHNDAEIGNPAVQEVSLSPEHYTSVRQEFSADWFDTIAELKNRTRLSVGGLWFGPPDFDRMSGIMRNYPNLFDGVVVDWDSGKGACMSKLKTPPHFSRNGHQNSWWNPKTFFMRYYIGGQDVEVCRLPDRTPYTTEPFVYNNLRGKCSSS
ncbi:hypothetical protein BESB_043490 [Besnoitia besnoiti]|uniref:Uncharacterized protein n=1 Tax=Besnoitia besnoiti TaxID=94643 RepID=A0A2A9MKK8_BESBE|nr:hypothetical protein BESB_043490 [Besnoitia besnoiti]PFH36157.1 hypothetical protein BESB_043490 [Besnoitia besnoiti]